VTTFINQAWGSLCSSPYYQTVSLSSQSQYAVHDMNIHSLHPAFVGEWHPETRAKVLQWLDIGSDGDTTPFQNHLAAYNALEVSLFISVSSLFTFLICLAATDVMSTLHSPTYSSWILVILAGITGITGFWWNILICSLLYLD